MKYCKSILAASIAASLYASAVVHAGEATGPSSTDARPNTVQTPDAGSAAAGSAADAQTTPSNTSRNPEELGTIVVTGIRDSEAASLRLKQAADSHVDIVTSEDIGKLPAKNVADTLQRLPGVNISSSSASEGGFDENDRVSLRGTNPSMTQTLVNGHTVGTGDWFVLSQVQTVGRSVSYSLLPSEIVSEVVVHKSSEAKIVEGGSAGSVDIITRKPLEYAQPLTVEGSVGGVYSDLPGTTKGQFSGLLNWKNADNTFGVLVQGFYEQRALQRNGQEVIGGYNKIGATDPIAVAHPDLAGVYYPNLIGAALFTQKRTREGGVIDLEFKPNDNLTLDVNGFYSKLKADNYNRNYLQWASQFVPGGAGLQPGYTVSNNVLSSAVFAPQAGSTTPYGVYDQISRPGASSQSEYLTADAKWRASDHLTFTGQIGTTKGKGDSPNQDVIEVGTGAGAGASWQMRGLGQPINWSQGGNNSSPAAILPQDGWIFGDQNIHVTDKENWIQADGELAFDNSAFALSSLDFGARYAKHTRDNKTDIGQGPNFGSDWQNPAAYPTSFSTYPSDFASSLGGTFPSNIWYWTPAQLAAIDAKFANRDPVGRFNWQNIYKVEEKDSAFYVQANFAGDRWSANAGVRYVSTDENINYNTSNPEIYTVAGPTTGSAFGDYYTSKYDHTEGKLLPSANFKFDMAENLLTRVAVSQTMTRPDYSALAGSVSLDDLTHTGSGGNPQLKPIVSTNFDTSLEWYFAPRGLLSAGVYNMDLKDYVNFGPESRSYKDQNASHIAGHDIFNTYLVSVPVNVNGNVRGVELNYIQPIGEFFGIATNYTYASGHADNGAPLQGTSKNTFNISGYFENELFNARVSYTYRSSFFAGVSRTDTFFQSGIGNVGASLGYKINDWASVTLDALNLNDPTLKYYTQNPAYGKQPYAFYVNGRQYYVNFRVKF
jgi:iron complex outermembrane receptor protein